MGGGHSRTLEQFHFNSPPLEGCPKGGVVFLVPNSPPLEGCPKGGVVFHILIGAVKINNVMPDNFLPIKIQSVELTVVKPAPKKHLREISCLTKFSCTFPELRVVQQRIVVFRVSACLVNHPALRAPLQRRGRQPPRPSGTPPKEGKATTPPFGHPSKGGE